MFVINLKYIVPSGKVEKIRAEHIKFLDKFYSEGKFLISGRKYDGSGGLIIAISESKEEVEEIIRQDPFIKSQVAEYEIIGFNPTKKLDILDNL
jgi:uncharacterized protein YciI